MTPKRIIIHCSATPEGGVYTAGDIDRWHRANGWDGIGYHKVVLLDGRVEDGRPETRQGAHVAGHNGDTLAVCYIGGLTEDARTPKDTRTPAQRAAMLRVVRDWMTRYHIAPGDVLGHTELDPRKACPSFDVAALRRELAGAAPQPDAGAATNADLVRGLPMIGGPNATAGIQALQRWLGVTEDGWIGPKTYAALARHLGGR